MTANAVVQETITYNAWGASSSSVYGPYSLNASYTGKQVERSGLYNFNARLYDPSIGEFISEDPGRHHTAWYAYAHNDPTGHADLDGKEAESAHEAREDDKRQKRTAIVGAWAKAGHMMHATVTRPQKVLGG